MKTDAEVGQYVRAIFGALRWPKDESLVDLPSNWWWDTQDEVFLVNCNDTFYWACADAEPVEIADLDLLQQSYDDCYNLSADDYAALLFCCRKRKMRPMDQWFEPPEGSPRPYKNYIPAAARHLFEAAGPARPPHDEDAIWHGREGVHG